jgi:hypothetical protein
MLDKSNNALIKRRTLLLKILCIRAQWFHYRKTYLLRC